MCDNRISGHPVFSALVEIGSLLCFGRFRKKKGDEINKINAHTFVCSTLAT